MKESVLKSLMRLFAIVSQVHSIEETSTSKLIIEKYLKLIVRKDKIRQYLIMYDFYHNSLREREIRTGDKQLSLFSVKAVIICEQINKDIDRKQKVFILTHILEILSSTRSSKEEDIDFVKTIALAFKIDETLFYDCLSFVFDDLEGVQQKEHVLLINSQAPKGRFKHIFRDFLTGRIVFFYVQQANICIFRHVDKDDQLYYNEQKIEVSTTYIFEEGGMIKSPLMGDLFYNDVLRVFLHESKQDKVHFMAEKVSYQFPNSDTGLKQFTFSEESGQLIGIMGNSGVGKSTMLNLLNGSLTPNSGRILLNGFDVHKEEEKIRGLIGFIPQDDMLIEELTVFQNLYYNARLCFKNLEKEKVVRRVTRLLHDIGLSEVKHLKVGNPLNKFISGGQRKRLNIALELIREPNVLFVDEPTSGLSSSDSEIVMDLLKRQSLKGKLVIVNIHQPSSDIFKKIDRLLLIDTGGRVVFQGNPLHSLVYLKKFMQLVNAEEGECSNCGNINPEQILHIIESRNVNEYGDYTSERKVEAETWYANYQKTQEKELNQAVSLKIDLPKNEFNPQNRFNQFRIFGLRNILSKLVDRQYMLINFLEAPVLGLILGWFTRFNEGTEDDPTAYVFSMNANLPVYIFMSVVVAIFLGLMVSAEEIIRDKKVLKREAFLHLNRGSYYNSKVFYLTVVLAIQMLLFVLVGNTILEIKGMYFEYWLMLWITSMVAGILGLNLSSSFKTVVAIYIFIPILIVPQILLGGAMIPFNKLNTKLSGPVFVPVAGDVMPSRWAYEGLVILQFTKNKYMEELYPYEQQVSEASYLQNYLIPEVSTQFSELKRSITQNSKDIKIDQMLSDLYEGIKILSENIPNCEHNIEQREFNNFNLALSQEIEGFLQCSKGTLNLVLDKAISDRDRKIFDMEKKAGGLSNLLKIKTEYSNEQLSRLVTNSSDTKKIIQYEGQLIQLVDPVYKLPDMKFGRSHFFSAYKGLGNSYIETYWFNLVTLILFLAGFYFLLIFEVFKKAGNIVNQKNINWLLLQIRIRVLNTFKSAIK